MKITKNQSWLLIAFSLFSLVPHGSASEFRFEERLVAPSSESVIEFGVVPRALSTEEIEKIEKYNKVIICLTFKTKLLMAREWSYAFDKTNGCSERLIANLETKRIYFNYDEWEGNTYVDGGRVAYCPPRQLEAGYGPCNSYFMTPSADQFYKAASVDAVWSSLQSSGAEQALMERAKMRVEAVTRDYYERYRRNFGAISTEVDVENFKKFYQLNDPDNLIKQAEIKREVIRNKIYRERYEAIVSVTDMEAFIRSYEVWDPEDLVPGLKIKLEAEKLKKEHEDRSSEADGRIRFCKEAIRLSDETVRREREIGAATGYENKTALYEAGARKVDCQRALPGWFKEYRNLGGSKKINEF